MTVRYKLGSRAVDETSEILWDTIQSHEFMAQLLKHKINHYPSIYSIFIQFLIKSNIYEPLQKIGKIKKDIKGLRTKSYHTHVILIKVEE